jgi:hypothetical protein
MLSWYSMAALWATVSAIRVVASPCDPRHVVVIAVL